MPFTAGINFRASSGFVVDGTNEAYCLADTYPTVRGGFTFGYASGTVSTRDRDSSVDRRLAGVNFSGSAVFWLDLPSVGTYDVRLAMGDASNIITDCEVQLRDDTTVFATVGPHTVTNGTFYDATDVNWSSANWPIFNTAFSRTFVSTRLVAVLTSGSGTAVIAHLSATQTATVAPDSVFPLSRRAMHHYRREIFRRHIV